MRILDTKQMTKRTVRLMLEVTPRHAIVIAKALDAQHRGVVSAFSNEDLEEMFKTSMIITARLSDEQIEYPGQLYEIWAKGKRRAHLGLKREPDMCIGKAYGRNFLDACIYYCTCVMFCSGAYNPKKNTLSGYVLYSPPQE